MLRNCCVIALSSWLLAFGQAPDKAIWDEYGLEGSPETVAAGCPLRQIGSQLIKQKCEATIFRLKDPTCAFAAFQWQRPADSRPSKLAPLAAETPNQLLVAHGNYLVRFDGRPDAAGLKDVLDRLLKVDQGPSPQLANYLPESDRIPNFERYLLGPESLAKFVPEIPPSVAAFHLGAEAEAARFRSKGGGELDLVIFSYPTPQLARQRVAEFQKRPGLMAKREGPLVAVVLSGGDPGQAERLLARVNYQATITWDQYVPTRRDNIGVLVINCFTLAGVLLAFCAVAGLAFGGVRAISQRWLGLANTPDPIITLGLDEK